MEREDIEQAARDYSGRWAPGPIHINDIYRRDDFEAGFTTGAEWMIYSVWHDVQDVPDNDRMILVLCDSGHCLIAGPNNEQWEDTVKELKLNKWAYIDDLIPDEK